MNNNVPPVAKKFSGTGVTDSEAVDIVNKVAPAAEAASGGGIEVAPAASLANEALDHEKFMRDELEVFLADAQSENDAGYVEVTVNGDYRLGLRGSQMKLRRYHVAVLAQAKQARLRQTKITNPDGSVGFREETVLALTYPFTVVHDPNPRLGAPWLRSLLSSPG